MFCGSAPTSLAQAGQDGAAVRIAAGSHPVVLVVSPPRGLRRLISLSSALRGMKDGEPSQWGSVRGRGVAAPRCNA